MKTTYIVREKSWVLAIMFAVFAGGLMASIATPVTVSAASCAKPLLTFPVWYRGLVGPAPACNLKTPDAMNTSPKGQPSNGLSNFIWRIVLNVIEIGLQAVGYIAVGFILYGGFLFMTSQGSPDGAAKARKTIQNAAIGLVLSIASVAIVNLVVGII